MKDNIKFTFSFVKEYSDGYSKLMLFNQPLPEDEEMDNFPMAAVDFSSIVDDDSPY